MNHATDLSGIFQEATEAQLRINEQVDQTPLEYSDYLSQLSGGSVYLKCECWQRSGSFKIRGAANYILSLTDKERAQGLVTASTGNHATAFASLVDRLKIKGTIFMPEDSSPAKTTGLSQYNVLVETFGSDCVESESHARQVALQNHQIYISPYNHLKIIAGQATIALELIDQLPQLDTVIAPVGGGGLISGIAALLKSKNEGTQVLGCQSANSAVMYHSLKAGEVIEIPSLPTIADGAAGGIETDCLTFAYCRELVDRFVLVSEDEIRAAIRLMVREHQMIIEGSAALSVASFLKEVKEFSSRSVVLILTGRKISMNLLREILAES